MTGRRKGAPKGPARLAIEAMQAGEALDVPGMTSNQISATCSRVAQAFPGRVFCARTIGAVVTVWRLS